MDKEVADRSRIGTKGDEQKSRAESKIFEEIPKQRSTLAAIRAPKIARLPELFPEQGGNAAISRQDEGAGTVRDPGNNPQRHEHFDEQSDEDQSDRNCRVGRRLTRLSNGAAKVKDFVQSTEWKK